MAVPIPPQGKVLATSYQNSCTWYLFALCKNGRYIEKWMSSEALSSYKNGMGQKLIDEFHYDPNMPEDDYFWGAGHDPYHDEDFDDYYNDTIYAQKSS